jgi:DNA polymerase-3 subunit alpha
LICAGDTKGVFQLESNLGKKWAKESQPRNIKELAALISLIRPGTLLAKHKSGKNMTEIYCLRKSGAADFPVQYDHESLEPILKETYGVLVYQEQSMQIAQKLAGFDLKEADVLRKAIGKKKADLMEKVKKSFLEGAENKGIVTKEIAEEIFANIEKSNRYAFNKSHAVAYAINAYWAAYCKHHRRKKFYQVWLDGSKGKPKEDIEKKQLIMDARRAEIDVYPPRLGHLYSNFTIDENRNIIYYGLNYIKHVGTKECEKLANIGDVSEYTWMDCLCNIIYKLKINKRSAIALISVGAFTGKNNRECRQKMLYEFDSWKQLTAREQEAIVEAHNEKNGGLKSFSEGIDAMTKKIKVTAKRSETVADIKDSIDNPFYNLDDESSIIAIAEEKYLSCSLTCSKVDGVGLNISVNMCKEIVNESIIGKASLAVEIERIKVIKTKKGNEMAFLTIEDTSGSLDSTVVFPDTWEQYKNLLIESNTVLLIGEVQQKDRGSFIVNQVKQI